MHSYSKAAQTVQHHSSHTKTQTDSTTMCNPLLNTLSPTAQQIVNALSYHVKLCHPTRTGPNITMQCLCQVFSATSPDSSAVIDSGSFVTPSPRTIVTHVLQHLVDQAYYTVWLVAEDMQAPPLQQSTASPVAWQQPFLMPPQMNASIVNGSIDGDRWAWAVTLSCTVFFGDMSRGVILQSVMGTGGLGQCLMLRVYVLS